MWRYVLLLLSILAMSTSVIWIKAGASHPFIVAALRLLVACVLLAPVFLRDRARHRDVFTRDHLRRTFLPAVVLALHFLTWSYGARLTLAAQASLVVNLAPAERVQAARKQARQAFLASNGAATVRQVREAEQQAAEAAMKVQSQKRKFTDPLTRHVFEYDVDVDGLGNVVRVAEPTISAFDPVTQKIDTDFAVQNQEWVTGGRQRSETNIRKLYSALTNLDKTGFEASFQSGGFAGLPLIKSAVDVVLDLPKQTEREVLSVAAESLREILGGQFAMKEGQQVLERAYDRYAKEGTNKQFVAALLDTIAETAAEKESQAKYFQENGTMAGYSARPMITNASTLESRINQRLGEAAGAAPKTPAQQASATAMAKAQQALYDYLAKRQAAPAQ
jgi:hypothetical protein